MDKGLPVERIKIGLFVLAAMALLVGYSVALIFVLISAD